MAEQRTAIVTGAGTGVGKSVATALLKDGWNTVFCGRRLAVLEDAVNDAGKTEGKALACSCDVTKPDDVDHLFDTAEMPCSRLDLLFNNAGMGYKATTIDDIPVDV